MLDPRLLSCQAEAGLSVCDVYDSTPPADRRTTGEDSYTHSYVHTTSDL